ncbi:MOSC domain-containing protein [bacterium]|nr:MOSC domain-containing protein [bacterium]
MIGQIIQINVSSGGVPKRPVASAFVSFERVEGDDWRYKDVHGGAQQVILMIAQENIDTLAKTGFSIFPGALGENFTTTGIDYKNIRYGDVFKAGDTLEFRITKRRAPCRTILVYGAAIGEAIFDRAANEHDFRSEKWGMSGFYAEILKEGSVKTGDAIEKINRITSNE